MTTETDDQEIKDLEYYALNPDEMPDDPSLVEGIADTDEEVSETVQEPAIPTIDLRTSEEETIEEPPTPEPEKVVAEETPPVADPEEEKLPVATKDGKGAIPYEVLATARRNAQEANQRAEAAEQRAKEAEDKALQPPVVETPPVPDEEEPDWEQLAEEYPQNVIDVMKNSWQTARAAREDAKVARAEAESLKSSQVDEVRDDSQTAIDANPTLATWQANHPEAWKQAGQMDDLLKEQEEWQTKSLDERFVKVVEMVHAMNPDAPLVTPPPADPPAQTDKEREAAALKGAKPAIPTSLSDVPGGTPPPNSEIESLESVSSTQLAAKMENLDPDKLEEFLDRYDV